MGEKKENKGGVKKLLLGVLIGVAFMTVLFFVIFLITKEEPETTTTSFGDHLNAGNFTLAYKEFEGIDGQYHGALDDYALNIVSAYNNASFTYDEASELFVQLTAVGFSEEIITECKALLESLNESKEFFITANSLYSEGSHLEAKDCYNKVIEEDTNYLIAQEKISEIDTLLQTSVDNYKLADELYLSNDTDKALEQYQMIIDNGVNPQAAQDKIAIIQDIKRAWDAEFDSQESDRCTYPHGVAAQDDFIYLPYSFNNSYSIVKYNLSDETTEIFKLAEMAGNLIISDINIVDNYLYFVAGENVGTGRTYDNPYSIYRMKNDGTQLERAAAGDYKNLIAFKDGFYASSYSKGLVKLDRNLKPVETISQSLPKQMQLVEGSLYYTVAEYTATDMIHAQYVYDGKSSEKVRQENSLRFGFYSGTELYAYKAYEYYEKLYYENKAEDKLSLLKFDDIKDMFGLVGSNVVFTMETLYGKVNYYIYDTEERAETKISYKVPANATELNSIYFDKEMIIFSTKEGFVFTDSDLNFISEINLTSLEMKQADAISDVKFRNEPNYTDEEVVVVEDEYWHYSSETYHITIESQYLVDVDTRIYIAQIKTTDPEGIFIDSPEKDSHITMLMKSPKNLSRQFSAVLACNGDFFDEPSNTWTGISIRDGIVYKKLLVSDMMAVYPGGKLVCHSKDENVTYEDLLYAGVRDTLSFGPILLKDGEYGSDIYTNFVSMGNPRCSLGMVEPGNYVVILCDGRQPTNSGLTLKRLADLYVNEGCVEAYNLDGGQTAAMLFMGEYINTHEFDFTGKNFRHLREIVYFGTSDLVPEE